MILDLATRVLTDGERRVKLSRTRCLLLETLTYYPAGAHYEVLFQALWPDGVPGNPSNCLKVLVVLLRRELASADWPRPIRNLHDEGYRLMRPVEVRRRPGPAVVPDFMLPALLALLRSHPDQRAAAPFLRRLDAHPIAGGPDRRPSPAAPGVDGAGTFPSSQTAGRPVASGAFSP
jgi:hypothetical protein